MKKIFLLGVILLLLTGCGLKKEKVVIYSSNEEVREQALKEQLKTKFPDYDVVVLHMSTGNTAAKIKNEGKNIEADIILSLENAHIKNLLDNFASLKEFDASKVYLDETSIAEKYFLFNKLTMSIFIDNKYFKKHQLEIPRTYEDLLKPQYKNLIAMPDPKTSCVGYSYFLNVVNIMGENKAVEYFKKLKNNLKMFTPSGAEPTNQLKLGEIAIAMGQTIDGVNAINEGYDFSIIELDTGAPYNFSSMAIIKGKDRKSVKEVFSWLLNDFIYYDKENFSPEIILKNQNNKMANYPVTKKYADMTGVDDVKLKEHLTKIWNEVNG